MELWTPLFEFPTKAIGHVVPVWQTSKSDVATAKPKYTDSRKDAGETEKDEALEEGANALCDTSESPGRRRSHSVDSEDSQCSEYSQNSEGSGSSRPCGRGRSRNRRRGQNQWHGPRYDHRGRYDNRQRGQWDDSCNHSHRGGNHQYNHLRGYRGDEYGPRGRGQNFNRAGNPPMQNWDQGSSWQHRGRPEQPMKGSFNHPPSWYRGGYNQNSDRPYYPDQQDRGRGRGGPPPRGRRPYERGGRRPYGYDNRGSRDGGHSPRYDNPHIKRGSSLDSHSPFPQEANYQIEEIPPVMGLENVEDMAETERRATLVSHKKVECVPPMVPREMSPNKQATVNTAHLRATIPTTKEKVQLLKLASEIDETLVTAEKSRYYFDIDMGIIRLSDNELKVQFYEIMSQICELPMVADSISPYVAKFLVQNHIDMINKKLRVQRSCCVITLPNNVLMIMGISDQHAVKGKQILIQIAKDVVRKQLDTSKSGHVLKLKQWKDAVKALIGRVLIEEVGGERNKVLVTGFKVDVDTASLCLESVLRENERQTMKAILSRGTWLLLRYHSSELKEYQKIQDM